MKVPAPAMAIAAMISVQLGAALSSRLFAAVTPAGTVWMRLTVAAVILLAVTRPPLLRLSPAMLRGTVLLGAVTGLMTLMFMEAVARIPLGTAVAIEFLGPLTVAALRSRRRSAVIWPALALAGVVGLTQPWSGPLNMLGIAFAATSALSWGGYILLTQKVGAASEGLQGLALSLTVAALVTAPFGAGAAISGLTPAVAAQAVGLGILVPLLPFALEMLALRRMAVAAFGTLMALEPGIATVLGLVVLRQAPELLQVIGVVLVMTAGIGAQRGDRPAGNAPKSPDDDPLVSVAQP
ncbi:inner membrane transporter RhtA [Nakamurella sp. UYEF19]|uniref:EamA family transporter n=1 Tax=Nakamurella sp. UYEF19 TaxID=1756392 RepID=UPI0033927F42